VLLALISSPSQEEAFMSSQLSRLWAISNAIALAFAITACSSPTAPSVSSPVAAAALTSTATDNQAKHWPVRHPDGAFGHEDPNYPPEPWQCPRGYNVVYNGWNFVCATPYCCDHEFPRVDGYPDDWKP
jgi:hypothetical protein